MKNLFIEFESKELQELYSKGFSDAYAEIPKYAINDFLTSIQMACAASDIDDLDFPPFKRLLQDDNTCSLLLYDGWVIKFFIEFTNDGNKVKVISLFNSKKGGRT